MTINKSHSRARREQGFTLVEVLVAVAIAAVLAAIALPNMSTFIQNNARSSRMNELTLAFNIARNEAVAKQTIVTVCASTTLPTPVNYTCNNTNAYQNGWIVMSDANADGVVNGADQVLRITEPDMAGSATLIGTDSLGASIPRVSFNSTGQATGLTVNLTRVKFTYCDSRGVNAARAIIMMRTGHAKTSRDGPDGDNIHEAGGVNLTCPA